MRSFATVVIAYLFARLKVIQAEHAAQASLLSGAIYLSGGIIGTLHHLYFAGTPTIALAFGSVFSALEIVPLVFVGYEAFENIRHSKVRPWLAQYKWVVYFFVAVAFWNLVGAGIFGFMINPPIALYYMQGLNTTAVHAHGSSLWRLRHTRPRPFAVLHACNAAGTEMEHQAARFCILGDQYRYAAGDLFEPAADRPDADIPVGFGRLLVGPQPGIYADRRDADAQMDANVWRHHFRHRCNSVCLVCLKTDAHKGENPEIK